jgi:hypothetical protein
MREINTLYEQMRPWRKRGILETLDEYILCKATLHIVDPNATIKRLFFITIIFSSFSSFERGIFNLRRGDYGRKKYNGIENGRG